MTSTPGVNDLAERARENLKLPFSMEYVLRRGVEDHRFFSRFWFDWDPHPAQLVWGSHRAKRSFLVTGARSGKSEGEADRRWRRMFYRPDTFHGNGSITMQQARIVHDKMIMLSQRRGGRFQPFIQNVRESPFPEITLRNGARHTCRSTQLNAKYLRGEKFHEFNVDECAYEKQQVWDEVLSLRVADNDGLLSATTTPKGKNWVFYEASRARAIMRSQLARNIPVPRLESFFRHGPSYENPHFSKRALKRLRRMPARAWAQEVEGLFVELQNQLFTDDNVSKFTNTDLNLTEAEGGLAPTVRSADHLYAMGIDFARKRHKTVIILGRVDCRPWRVFKVVTLSRVPWERQVEIIDGLREEWQANVRYDSDGLGDVVGSWLGLKPEKYGTVGQGTSADQMLVGLQQAGTSFPPLFNVLYDADLDFDLRHYTWDADEETDEDGDIVHWDHLKAMAYFVYEARRLNPDQSIVTTGGSRVSSAIIQRQRRSLADLQRM